METAGVKYVLSREESKATGHLRKVPREYFEYYQEATTHLGLAKDSAGSTLG